MKPGKGQFDTGSLQKMGKALGWQREVHWHPKGFRQVAVKRDVDMDVEDAIIEPGTPSVVVKKKK